MRRWAAWMALCGLVACDVPAGPRRLPFPTLEASDLFPELGARERSSRGSSPDDSAFERALAVARRAQGTTPDTSGAAELQRVVLCGRLVGEVPRSFDEWRWASDGERTLVSHHPGGLEADALVYAEAFGSMGTYAPSAELTRFHLSIDPALTAMPQLVKILTDPIRHTDASPEWEHRRVAAEAALNLARGVGGGLGFHAHRDSFSGWKWVGENPGGVQLRLAKSHGVWGPPQPLDAETLGLLDELAGEHAAARDLIDDVAASAPKTPAAARRRTGDATLIYGSAEVRGGRVLHLALVCSGATCPVAADLRAFIESLRRPRPGENGGAGQSGLTFAALAQQLGLSLSHGGARDRIPDVGSLLESVLTPPPASEGPVELTPAAPTEPSVADPG